MIDKEVPLYSETAERAVLGCMIVMPKDCCQIAADSLTPSDFFVAWNGRLFSLLVRMWQNNKPIDTITVSSAISRSGSISDAEALGVMCDSMTTYKSHTHILGYIAEVKAKSAARALQSAATALLTAAHGDPDDMTAVADAVATQLDHVSAGSTVHVHKGDEPWEKFIEDLTKPSIDDSNETLATGYGHLDHAVKIRGGHVVVIGAVQKLGKSTLAVSNLAVRWWEQGIPGCVCSLEMRIPDVQSLILANISGLTRDDIEARNLTDEKVDIAFKGVGRAKKWPYAIFDRTSFKPRELRALAREQARLGARFLVIDYFQLMEPEHSYRNEKRHAELEDMMRSIKVVALETNLAIILVSQLNAKTVEGKDGGRPTLGDLRGTGAIAQDADAILLLSEPSKERVLHEGNRCRQLICDITNRRGSNRTIKWLFDGSHARFIETK